MLSSGTDLLTIEAEFSMVKIVGMTEVATGLM